MSEPTMSEPSMSEPVQMTAALAADLERAREVARAGLEEVTDASTIGAVITDDTGIEVLEPTVIRIFFGSTLRGYPHWRWAATVAKVSETEPVTVLEVGLLPTEAAVLAPEWVPWSERLAQYRESQKRIAEEEAAKAEEAAAELADVDDVDPDDDVLDNDYADFDVDLDGVDLGEEDDDTEDHDADTEDADD